MYDESALYLFSDTFYIECIAKRCLISQYVTTPLSKAVKQDDRSLKLDPYWSIEDMMKQTKEFLHILAAVNNLNTECYMSFKAKNANKRRK